MARLIARLAAAMFVALAGAGPLMAADVALVIANLRFDEAKRLPPSVRDGAERLTDALSRFGYDVYGGYNLDAGEMRQALAGFSRAAEEADRTIIFYAGHALTTTGNTWLASTSTRPSIASASASALDFDVLITLARLAKQGALVVVETDGDGFNAQPPLRDGLGRLPAPPDVLVIQAPANRFGARIAAEFLGSGKNARQAARSFTQQVTLAGELRPGLRFGQDDPQARFKRAEDRLGLDEERRARIQVHLTILALSPGPIDGIFGPRTRQAITRWQNANGFQATGYLDQAQIAQLRDEALARRDQLAAEAEQARAEAERQDRAYWQQTGQSGREEDLIAYLRRYPDGIHADRARSILSRMNDDRLKTAQQAERDAWQRARRADSVASYNRYLQLYPRGLFVRQARARIEELRANATTDARRNRRAAQEQALGLNRLSLVRVERRLQSLGFNTGPADGVLDQQSRRAIRTYQRSRGVQPTGFLNEGTLRLLISETS
ncbi:MAG: peptidoglycan-binding protein [Pseudomonadota bacterium]